MHRLGLRHVSIMLLGSWAALTTIRAANQTTVNMDSGSHTLSDQNSVLLTGGTSADGNGAVLRLGYYNGATLANPFAGTFIPLTGEGSLNTDPISLSSPSEPLNKTSIGDLTSQTGAAGKFFLPGLNFVAGSSTSGNNLPATGTPLAIQIFNNTTIATSTYFNVVADTDVADTSAWLWKAPDTPPSNVNISLDDLGIQWLSINQGQAQSTAFATTIPTSQVPEPATVVAGSACAAALVIGAFRRRRRS